MFLTSDTTGKKNIEENLGEQNPSNADAKDEIQRAGNSTDPAQDPTKSLIEMTTEESNQEGFENDVDEFKSSVKSEKLSIMEISKGENTDSREHKITKASEIAKNLALFGDENLVVDPLHYDVTEEAQERARFNVGAWVEDFFVSILHPVSLIYVYLRYGYTGLQLRGFAPPTPEPRLGRREVHVFYDTDNPVYQPKAALFFSVSVVEAIFRIGLGVSFAYSSVWEYEEGDGKSRAPLYLFVMTCVVHVLFLMTRANKRAFRKKSSAGRMILHRERRNEEIFFGWLPLPKDVALFELRLAASRCGTKIEEKFITLDTSSEASVRRAIGDKILNYLERDGDGIVAVKPNEDTFLNEEEEWVTMRRPGCKLNMAAFLMRICLDKSYADPAFGEPPTDIYLSAHNSIVWTIYSFLMAALPFIVDILVRGGGTYSGWDVSVCAISTLMFIFAMQGPPQGFTYSAILTICRKTDMLSYLNELLYSDRLKEEDKDTSHDLIHDLGASHHKKWDHRMDLTCAHNIDNWQKMRDIIMLFGDGYQARCDANGGIVMLYVVLFTLLLALGTVIMGADKLDWYNYAFYLAMHLSLILPMGAFAIVLALEGDKNNNVADQSKMALTSAMISLEVRNQNGELTKVQRDRMVSARFATTQLHESLTSSTRLFPTQVLGIIELNRTVVLSIAFAVLTQITLMIENVDF